jgi:hypothetical protein
MAVLRDRPDDMTRGYPGGKTGHSSGIAQELP